MGQRVGIMLLWLLINIMNIKNNLQSFVQPRWCFTQHQSVGQQLDFSFMSMNCNLFTTPAKVFICSWNVAAKSAGLLGGDEANLIREAQISFSWSGDATKITWFPIKQCLSDYIGTTFTHRDTHARPNISSLPSHILTEREFYLLSVSKLKVK